MLAVAGAVAVLAADGTPPAPSPVVVQTLPPPPPAPPLPDGRIVDYTPAGFGPDATAAPDAAALAADAADLTRLGVRTVVLERATPLLAGVCPVFRTHGIAVVVGVEHPAATAELEAALAAAECAAGFAVSTSGQADERAALTAAVGRLRDDGGHPVAVRAPLAALRADATLLRAGDWTLVAADPYDAGHAHPQDACGWTISEARGLVDAAGGTPVVIDVGLPTAGNEMANEHYQRAFFACIESRQLRFSHREAIDQPWRGEPTRADYGLFRADGTPKRWAFQQLRPRVSLRVHAGRLRGRMRGMTPGRFRLLVWERHGAGPWTPRAPIPLGRDGKWHALAPASGMAAATLVAPGFVPAAPVVRLQVDGEQIFAVVEP